MLVDVRLFIAQGIPQGLRRAKYRDAGIKAYRGILDRFIRLIPIQLFRLQTVAR